MLPQNHHDALAAPKAAALRAAANGSKCACLVFLESAKHEYFPSQRTIAKHNFKEALTLGSKTVKRLKLPEPVETFCDHHGYPIVLMAGDRMSAVVVVNLFVTGFNGDFEEQHNRTTGPNAKGLAQAAEWDRFVLHTFEPANVMKCGSRGDRIRPHTHPHPAARSPSPNARSRSSSPNARSRSPSPGRITELQDDILRAYHARPNPFGQSATQNFSTTANAYAHPATQNFSSSATTANPFGQSATQNFSTTANAYAHPATQNFSSSATTANPFGQPPNTFGTFGQPQNAFGNY